jgi:hypothetical protein
MLPEFAAREWLGLLSKVSSYDKAEMSNDGLGDEVSYRGGHAARLIRYFAKQLN